MTEHAMRTTHLQFTATLEGLAGRTWNCRQQAANELAALRQEVRGAPLRGTLTTGVGVDARLLGKPSDFSGAQDAWRDRSTVFKGYAGAAIPRLQKLMDNAAKATHSRLRTPRSLTMRIGQRRHSSSGYDAHDLQGRSSQYRVPGRRQRRSGSLATTD